MGEPRSIGYLTESQARKWATEVRAAATLDKLRAVIQAWPRLVKDADTRGWTEADFIEFRRGLAMQPQHTPSEAWMERFTPVMLPQPMFECELLAEQFHVPFGTAYIRLMELGKLPLSDKGRNYRV